MVAVGLGAVGLGSFRISWRIVGVAALHSADCGRNPACYGMNRTGLTYGVLPLARCDSAARQSIDPGSTLHQFD